MSGLGAPFYPWPYTEGVTIQEAANELAFISTGLYGKPLPPQNGGPYPTDIAVEIRLQVGQGDRQGDLHRQATPLRSGRPSGPTEYGFWANVNPDVPHPRWSQASETLLGTNERVPTQLYNGYGAFVASLYDGLRDQKLFM